MARVVITVEDNDQGKIDAQVDFDPKLVEGEMFTDAQRVGLSLYHRLDEICTVEETPDED